MTGRPQEGSQPRHLTLRVRRAEAAARAPRPHPNGDRICLLSNSTEQAASPLCRKMTFLPDGIRTPTSHSSRFCLPWRQHPLSPDAERLPEVMKTPRSAWAWGWPATSISPGGGAAAGVSWKEILQPALPAQVAWRACSSHGAWRSQCTPPPCAPHPHSPPAASGQAWASKVPATLPRGSRGGPEPLPASGLSPNQDAQECFSMGIASAPRYPRGNGAWGCWGRGTCSLTCGAAEPRRRVWAHS